MSKNGSYAKSMNGIVSFDDGDGTVIEGDGITTGIINCITLNASSTVNSSTLNADFINKGANAYLTMVSDTTFNNKLYASSIWGSGGSAITWNNNSHIVGSLDLTSGLTTKYVEGIGGPTPQPLTLGQDNDFTSEIKICRATFTAGGYTFPAIPPRTSFYAVGNDDIANKLYVDTATAGTNILSLSNTFTGATNTFNNSIIVPTRTTSDNTQNCASTAFVQNRITALLNNNNNNWAASNYFNSVIVVPDHTVGSLSNDAANCLFVNNSIYALLNSVNTWGGTGENTFKNIVKFGKNISPIDYQISISSDSTAGVISSMNVSDTINLFKNITTGSINMASNLILKASSIASNASGDIISLFNNITGGSVKICSNLVFETGKITLSAAANTFNLFTNTSTGSENIATGMTTGTLTIGNTTSTTINQLGNIKMGNAINSLTTANDGVVTINKLQVGTGTGYRCMIIVSGVGGGSASGGITIPGAPTGFGNPIVFATINATNTYWININVTGANTFGLYYRRDYQSR